MRQLRVVISNPAYQPLLTRGNHGPIVDHLAMQSLLTCVKAATKTKIVQHLVHRRFHAVLTSFIRKTLSHFVSVKLQVREDSVGLCLPLPCYNTRYYHLLVAECTIF